MVARREWKRRVFVLSTSEEACFSFSTPTKNKSFSDLFPSARTKDETDVSMEGFLSGPLQLCEASPLRFTFAQLTSPHIGWCGTSPKQGTTLPANCVPREMSFTSDGNAQSLSQWSVKCDGFFLFILPTTTRSSSEPFRPALRVSFATSQGHVFSLVSLAGKTDDTLSDCVRP